MLPEHEIQLERKRLSNEIKTAVTNKLIELMWSSCDFAKAANKRPSTMCEFVSKDGNYETDTLVENFYYLSYRVSFNIERCSFKGYTAEKKLPKNQK